MLPALFHSLLFAQAASAPIPLEQVRLDFCLDKARADPGAAMIEASTWLGETSGASASYPQQCLGYAYTMLQGREEAAATSWRSVIAVEPGSEAAATARGYLAQLSEPATEASE